MRRDIEALLDHPEAPCVSVLAALNGEGNANGDDRQRVHLRLREVQGQLAAWGLGPREVAAIVEPAMRRLDQVPLPSSWRGLAIYLGHDTSRWVGLHAPVVDRVLVAERFLLRPLFRELGTSGRYWLLALSRKEPRLFRGDVDGLRLADESLSTFDAVVGADEAEPSIQVHAASGGPARTTVAYHGHGGSKDVAGEQVARWIHVLASEVDAVVQADRLPLVLAGVTERGAEYRRTTSYPLVLPTDVAGNPDVRSESELHALSWPLVEARLSDARTDALERYAAKAGTDWTVADPDEVVRAAQEGRVDVLLASAAPSPDHELTVEAAVVATWNASGTVHVVDDSLPGGGPVAALLRYVVTPSAAASGSPGT